MKQIISHFTDDDLYKFTMCCAVIDNFPRARVKYSFTDRAGLVYPEGFADRLTEQIIMLENLAITDEEIDFMKRRCAYIPHWFYNYLKGYRFPLFHQKGKMQHYAACSYIPVLGFLKRLSVLSLW